MMEKQLVPAGYKRTEVGVIPKDWEVSALERVARIIDPQPDHRTPPQDVGGEPYIGISNFKDDSTVDWDGCRKIISAAVDKQQASFQVRSGDIIFGKIGTIGLPKFLPVTSFRYALSANILLIQPNIDPRLVMAWLRSSQAKAAINRELHSTSQAAFGIHKMRAMLIPLPPSGSEQTAIANALSDVDALITSLEKLIAKKRAIKTAAMQQLLTGKKRLPPFDTLNNKNGTPRYKKTELGEIPVDWEVCNLPQYVWYQEGPGLRNWQFTARGMKVINVTNLQYSGFLDLDKTDRHISIELYEKMYRHFECDAGDFVMASSGNSYSKSSVVRECDLPLVMNTSVIRFKARENIESSYMKSYLKSTFFKDQIDLMITGGAQPNFGPYHLNRIFLPIPSSLEEQAAIATVLSDMENDLEALQQRLNKTQQIKQGMMQELLTGKTRLVPSTVQGA